MALKPISAPAAEPVTLAEAKIRLSVDHDEHNAMITDLIAAARAAAENKTGRALIAQTWELVLDAFPAHEIKLAKPPVSSIVSIQYIDPDGVQQTMDPADYSLDPDSLPGWVLPAYGTAWPATLDAANVVRVRFVAGYGAAATDVPTPVRQWINVTLATYYANREAILAGNFTELPNAFVDGLLDCYRIIEVA